MDQNKDKKEIVSNNNPQEILKNEDFDPSSFFRKDKNFTFAHQKIKKLAAAVYMITNHFDQSEPLKWSLRKISMDLLRLNIDFKDRALHGAEEVENTIRERVLELVSLLEVASFAGLVSSMNLAILKKEFNELISHIHRTLKAGERSGIRMDEAFFAVLPAPSPSFGYEEVSPMQQSAVAKPVVAPLVKNDLYHNQKTEHSINREKNVLYESREQIKEGEPHSSKEKLKDFSPVAVKKNKRQSIIINLLKRKKDVMIKDISSVISDCSEKTIQRELFALVDAGILKKEGERRWTKYSLVTE